MLWKYLLLGAVQGITEWFPVSSSGHLVFFQQILKLQPGVAFDALVHFASLLVILALFWKDLLGLALSPFIKSMGKTRRLLLAIIVGSIPAAFFGLIFRNQIEDMFSGFGYLAFAFLFTGIILLLSRLRLFEKSQITLPIAFAVGLAQAIAIIPGISRSGMTISFALMLGLSNKESARLSFLLAVPALAGAFLLESPKLLAGGINLPGAILGFIAALIVGFVSLKLLLRAVSRLHWFSAWCFVMAIFVFIFG